MSNNEGDTVAVMAEYEKKIKALRIKINCLQQKILSEQKKNAELQRQVEQKTFFVEKPAPSNVVDSSKEDEDEFSPSNLNICIRVLQAILHHGYENIVEEREARKEEGSNGNSAEDEVLPKLRLIMELGADTFKDYYLDKLEDRLDALTKNYRANTNALSEYEQLRLERKEKKQHDMNLARKTLLRLKRKACCPRRKLEDATNAKLLAHRDEDSNNDDSVSSSSSSNNNNEDAIADTIITHEGNALLIKLKQQKQKQHQQQRQQQPLLLLQQSGHHSHEDHGEDDEHKSSLLAALGFGGAKEEEQGNDAREYKMPIPCYVCRTNYKKVHHFYARLCPACANFSYRMRSDFYDLTGKIAVVTGARVKIGYETALRLLRCGATVIATTRFPYDALMRYKTEKDYENFKSRLRIFGLDLRDVGSISTFIHFLKSRSEPWVDILINNAAQTIRRPVDYYKSIIKKEIQMYLENKDADGVVAGAHMYNLVVDNNSSSSLALTSNLLGFGLMTSPQAALPGSSNNNSNGNNEQNEDNALIQQQIQQKTVRSMVALMEELKPTVPLPAAVLSMVPRTQDDLVYQGEQYFPTDQVDDYLEPIDLRAKNSWMMHIEEVSTIEAVEVQLCNSVSPFVLCRDIKPLMMASPNEDRFIVNVTSMEGYMLNLDARGIHPHTNMAKAALNSLTATIAEEYASSSSSNIYVCAVDPGWITEQVAQPAAERKRDVYSFDLPLDEVDAAARVLHPIVSGLRDKKFYVGVQLKDFNVVAW